MKIQRLARVADGFPANQGPGSNGLPFLRISRYSPSLDWPPLLPTVAITSPADASTHALPVDILGTATDETDLVRYLIEISPAGRNEYSLVVESDTPVSNGVLGSFDPTSLRNGFYDVRLTAED